MEVEGVAGLLVEAPLEFRSCDCCGISWMEEEDSFSGGRSS